MLIQNRKIVPPKPVPLVIPREGEDLVFLCGAVLDYTEFDKLYPEVPVPITQKPGGPAVPDPSNRNYLIKLADRRQARSNWVFLKSLLYTPELVFETVDINDPSTYNNVHTELEACLTQGEIGAIWETINAANAPSAEARKEALERFRASQPQAE